MAITVTNLVDFARAHNKLAILSGVGGVSNEPALTFGNRIKRRIISQPLNWQWNRSSEASFITSDGSQDYNPTSTDIYWVERAYAELESDTATPKYRYPLKVVRDLPANWEKGDPRQIAYILRNGVDLRWRIQPMPAATVWRIYIDYQKKPTALTALSDNFSPIPDEMQDVLCQYMLAFSYDLVDKAKYDSCFAKAEYLLQQYRKMEVVEETETGFIPERSLFLG